MVPVGALDSKAYVLWNTASGITGGINGATGIPAQFAGPIAPDGASVVAAFSQTALANPAGQTSQTNAIQQGVGALITPTVTGNVKVTVCGIMGGESVNAAPTKCAAGSPRRPHR